MNISPNLVVLLVALCCLVVSTEAKRKFRFDDDDCDTPTPPSSASRLADKLDNCPANAFTVALTTDLVYVGARPLREYSGNVLIGGLNRDLRFDTTARATWLPRSDYDCQESDASCKRVQKKFELQVSGGKLKGDVYEHTIVFCADFAQRGKCSRDKLKLGLSQHRLLAARDPIDNEKGAIGLSPEQSNDLGGATFLQALKQQGLSPRFGLYLRSFLRMDESDPVSELVIGCVNERRFNKGIESYHSLVGGGNDGWKVKLNGVKVGDSLIPNSNTPAILDTGHEPMIAPRAAFEEIRKLLKANEEGEFDCGMSVKIVMTFTIDTQVYSIDSKSYLIHSDEGSCRLSIDPWDKSEWSLGTSFLRNYYTIFEQDNHRVGFAKLSSSQ